MYRVRTRSRLPDHDCASLSRVPPILTSTSCAGDAYDQPPQRVIINKEFHPSIYLLNQFVTSLSHQLYHISFVAPLLEVTWVSNK